MRARSSQPSKVDLSRLCRHLGGEVRRHLDTSPGFPVHHRAPAMLLRRLKLQLSNPDPKARARAIAKLRLRILGRNPSPPNWRERKEPAE